MSDRAVLKLTKRYLQTYNERLNWPLTQPVSVGDVGKWSSGKRFQREFNLADEGISVATMPGPAVTSRALATQGTTDISFKLAAEAPRPGTALVAGKAGVSIKLSASSACVLRARSLKSEVASDLRALELGLVGLEKPSDWWKHRVVVSAILKADVATVALSHSSGQRVDINAEVSTVVPFDIADPSLGLSVGFQGSDTTLELLASGIVLAFQLTTLRSNGRWWHSWKPELAFV